MNVSLFITCMADVFYPQVGKSVVHLLRKFGCNVDFPMEQTCCGQPAYNSGYQEEARQVAKQLIRSFAKSDYVVSPSGSCVAMIRHYYPNLFATDDQWREEAQRLADKTYEFSEFLVHVLGIRQIEARYKGIATYHHSCHMSRGLGVISEPLQLLNNIEQLELIELPNKKDCCGFGGTFSVKMPEISEQMTDEKVEHILSTGAEMLVGSDMACLMNIAGRLNRLGHKLKVYHVAELIYEGVKNVEAGNATTTLL
jgi:L-lactate dehydrogenase complex protein LldE